VKTFFAFVALLLPALAKHVLQPQWERAVPVAALLLFANSTAMASGILTTFLTARGFSKVWMQIVIGETALMWLLGLAGLLAAGVIGIAAAAAREATLPGGIVPGRARAFGSSGNRPAWRCAIWKTIAPVSNSVRSS